MLNSIDLLIAAQNTPASVWLRAVPAVAPMLTGVNLAACAGMGLSLLWRTQSKAMCVGSSALMAAAVVSGVLLMLAEPFRYGTWQPVLLEAGLIFLGARAILRMRIG